MTGRTHAAVGMAAAVFVVEPQSTKDIIMCLGAAMIGGVISDIDTKSSDAHKEFRRTLLVIMCAVLSMGLGNRYLHTGLLSLIDQNHERFLCGLAFLLFLCVYGALTIHRTFTHSILGVILFTSAVYIMYEPAAISFGLAMSSHVLIDLLNKKKVQILYPVKKKVALCICASDKKVNQLIGYLASMAMASKLTLLISNLS